MGAHIEVAGLTMAYDDVVVVDDVSFQIAPGEFFGLIGPNGAGKTTTLEMVEGLRRPLSGTVTIDGIDPASRDPKLLRRIGVQLQTSAFFERLTAREQLQSFAALYDAPRAAVGAMLELAGLEDKAGTQTSDLSGGQRQRLSIACALVHDPDVVFLDEPTASLDPQARRNLWDVLRSLNDDGRTVILTTHHMDEAQALCDRVAIIDGGKILQLDSPAALIRGLNAPVRISLAPGTLALEEARGLSGVISADLENDALIVATRDPVSVLTALAGLGALEGLSVAGASLEDVFLELTGREYRA
ncbi:MAG: transporter [Nocardioidaceae bacterium]|nr:transporter [Nocardioidaceae bacterium]